MSLAASEILKSDQNAQVNDGTVDGVVLETATASGRSSLFSIGLASSTGGTLAGGRYFLARCGAQTPDERAENWQIYLRRPLFVCDVQRQPTENDQEKSATGFDRWTLMAPPGDDPGYDWLDTLGPGETINLIGPQGNGFALADSCRNLLVLAEADWLPTLLPVINQMLDHNGRVTAIVLHDGKEDATALLASLPIAVEVHVADSEMVWRQTVTDTVRWADQICAAVPHNLYQALAEIIRNRRFRLEPQYAQVLVRADLVCGYGGCLACTVPTANGGVTRACVHGPVMDLAHLAA